MDRFGKDCCRERKKCNEQQVQSIQEQQRFVDVLNELEKGMVVYPNSADHDETHRVSQVRGPKHQEAIAQIGNRRDFNLQNQKSYGNGENPIAESFKAICLHTLNSRCDKWARLRSLWFEPGQALRPAAVRSTPAQRHRQKCTRP
jgi:hypothetical protein